MAKKENAMTQQKHIQSSMMSDWKKDEQRMSELRIQVDNLKSANSLLQRDIRGLQELVTEQRVRLLLSLGDIGLAVVLRDYYYVLREY